MQVLIIFKDPNVGLWVFHHESKIHDIWITRNRFGTDLFLKFTQNF